MTYAEFRKELLSVINNFLTDMDEVQADQTLSEEEKTQGFFSVADKHGFSLDEPLTVS